MIEFVYVFNRLNKVILSYKSTKYVQQHAASTIQSIMPKHVFYEHVTLVAFVEPPTKESGHPSRN